MAELWRYLPVLVLVVQLLMGWVLWSLRKEFVAKKSCEECREGISGNVAVLDKRMTRAEGVVENMPNAEVVHSLALLIEGLSGDVQALGKQVEGVKDLVERVERVVARHEEHLLNGGR